MSAQSISQNGSGNGAPNGAVLEIHPGVVTVPLSSLAPGVHAHIFKLGSGGKDDPQVCYLTCLGFCPGAHVELIRRVSRGALAVYRVDDADVALRRETAALISVVVEK